MIKGIINHQKFWYLLLTYAKMFIQFKIKDVENNDFL